MSKRNTRKEGLAQEQGPDEGEPSATPELFSQPVAAAPSLAEVIQEIGKLMTTLQTSDARTRSNDWERLQEIRIKDEAKMDALRRDEQDRLEQIRRDERDERRKEREADRNNWLELLRESQTLSQKQGEEEMQEKRRRERKNAGKNLPTMTKLANPENLEPYINTLETNLKKFDVPEEYWMVHLVPLLDEGSVTFLSYLDEDTQSDFYLAKAALLKYHGFNEAHYRSKWNSLLLVEGQTGTALGQKGACLLNSWTKDITTLKELKDMMAKEKVITIMPAAMKEWVLRQRPKTLQDACELVDVYRSSSSKNQSSAKAGENSYKQVLRPNAAAYKPNTYTNNLSPTNQDNTAEAKANAAGWDPKKGFNCHSCKQWGHKARDCPNKTQEKPRCNMGQHLPMHMMDVYQGKINNQPVKNILINTGCSMSQVHPEWIDPNFDATETILLQGAMGSASYPVTTIQMELKGKSFQQKVLVNDDQKYDAVLGVDVKGLRGLVQKDSWIPSKDSSSDKEESTSKPRNRRNPRRNTKPVVYLEYSRQMSPTSRTHPHPTTPPTSQTQNRYRPTTTAKKRLTTQPPNSKHRAKKNYPTSRIISSRSTRKENRKKRHKERKTHTTSTAGGAKCL